MQSKMKHSVLKWIANAWLPVPVHFDAFRAEPAAYLTAAKWWILRKRLRARAQFALLLGLSPKSYMLWCLRTEQRTAPSPPDQWPPIIALIGHDGHAALLDDTLASLANESVQAVLIGPNHAADLAAATAVINWQAQPWLFPIRAGDRLAPGGAATYRAALADTALTDPVRHEPVLPHLSERGADQSAPEGSDAQPPIPAVQLLYADDDQIDSFGRRNKPHLKPDWNSELFAHFDYLTGACILKVELEDLIAAGEQADWAHALVATATARGKVGHVRRVLHARRHRPEPLAPPRPMEVVGPLPMVSVIVPTRNRLEMLRTCLAGLETTQYPEIEVIVVDNDSDDPATLAYLGAQDPAQVRVLRHPGPFNYSTINNRAVAEARGQLLCLLNNDIEVLAPDWLGIMVKQAQRNEVGAVGAQLLYPDGRIQHAGVAIGVGNAAGHAHRFLDPAAEGYFRRHALPQFTAAVTGACLVVARERFLAVGGLDERNFAVAFNDVDLCLRLNQRGWQSLYEPRAVLVHHESASRGHDLDPVGAARFASELAALQRIWSTDQIVDPFHHPQLSRASEQFVLAL